MLFHSLYLPLRFPETSIRAQLWRPANLPTDIDPSLITNLDPAPGVLYPGTQRITITCGAGVSVKYKLNLDDKEGQEASLRDYNPEEGIQLPSVDEMQQVGSYKETNSLIVTLEIMLNNNVVKQTCVSYYAQVTHACLSSPFSTFLDLHIL